MLNKNYLENISTKYSYFLILKADFHKARFFQYFKYVSNLAIQITK